MICVCVRVPVRAYTLRAGIPARPSGASIPDGFAAFRNQRIIADDPGGLGAAPAAGLSPDDYFDYPERAVALLNAVIASGGDLKAVEQALVVVALALKRAGLRTR